MTTTGEDTGTTTTSTEGKEQKYTFLATNEDSFFTYRYHRSDQAGYSGGSDFSEHSEYGGYSGGSSYDSSSGHGSGSSSSSRDYGGYESSVHYRSTPAEQQQQQQQQQSPAPSGKDEISRLLVPDATAREKASTPARRPPGSGFPDFGNFDIAGTTFNFN